MRARVRVVSLRVFRVRASICMHTSISATRICLKVGALRVEHTGVWAGCALLISTGRLWWLCF